jgi:hypothetical protein
MNVDEDVKVVHSVGIDISEDVNVDSMMVDDRLNDLASQFEKHLEEKDDVERKKEVKMYLGDGCEDLNDYKLDIFELVEMKYHVKYFIYSALQLKSKKKLKKKDYRKRSGNESMRCVQIR